MPSAPFVASPVDVTGVVIYFTIALFIMKGTLLEHDGRAGRLMKTLSPQV